MIVFILKRNNDAIGYYSSIESLKQGITDTLGTWGWNVIDILIEDNQINISFNAETEGVMKFYDEDTTGSWHFEQEIVI
jgi:hypothetical protein